MPFNSIQCDNGMGVSMDFYCSIQYVVLWIWIPMFDYFLLDFILYSISNLTSNDAVSYQHNAIYSAYSTRFSSII